MKDKTNLKMIVAIIVSVIISSGVSVFATIRFNANEIGYNTTTVADALDSMYQTMFSNNYSTTEKVVGTWIDGKPLYQKTYSFSAMSISTSQLNFGDIEELNMDYGDVVAVNFNENEYYEGEGDIKVWIRKPDNNFGTIGERSFSGTLYVTIQYTKTTDTVPQN